MVSTYLLHISTAAVSLASLVVLRNKLLSLWETSKVQKMDFSKILNSTSLGYIVWKILCNKWAVLTIKNVCLACQCNSFKQSLQDLRKLARTDLVICVAFMSCFHHRTYSSLICTAVGWPLHAQWPPPFIWSKTGVSYFGTGKKKLSSYQCINWNISMLNSRFMQGQRCI